MSLILAQDKIIDLSKGAENISINKLIPSDIDKTNGLPKHLTLIMGVKVMLRYNVSTNRGLVNGANCTNSKNNMTALLLCPNE